MWQASRSSLPAQQTYHSSHHLCQKYHKDSAPLFSRFCFSPCITMHNMHLPCTLPCIFRTVDTFSPIKTHYYLSIPHHAFTMHLPCTDACFACFAWYAWLLLYFSISTLKSKLCALCASQSASFLQKIWSDSQLAHLGPNPGSPYPPTR